jgi:hypothetical protein
MEAARGNVIGFHERPAPDELLSILERDLKSNDPAVLGLLRPADMSVFGPSPSRTGLLWEMRLPSGLNATLADAVTMRLPSGLILTVLKQLELEVNEHAIDAWRAIFDTGIVYMTTASRKI